MLFRTLYNMARNVRSFSSSSKIQALLKNGEEYPDEFVEVVMNSLKLLNNGSREGIIALRDLCIIAKDTKYNPTITGTKLLKHHNIMNEEGLVQGPILDIAESAINLEKGLVILGSPFPDSDAF